MSNVFTSYVNVVFFHGAALPDPARLSQGTGKFMRHRSKRWLVGNIEVMKRHGPSE
jgi:hypothetical protein